MNAMQKGFAALELIITVFIISVLLSCAVPNAARIVDRVSLDYEIKRLYTEMRFLQSHERMTFMRDGHFDTLLNSQSRLIVRPKRYTIVNNNNDKIVYDEHYFIDGVTASQNDKKDWFITFDDMGKAVKPDGDILNGHIVFTSRRGKNLYFVFDSVGRFRGSRTRPPS